jgi:hypothetical protein
VDDSKWERWGALGGILFVIMVVVSALLPGSPPKTSDSAAKIVKFFGDKGDEIRWAGYIGLLATIPLFWWVSSVWRLMRRGEGGSPRLTVMAMGGAVFAAVTAAVAAVILAVVPLVGVKTVGPGAARFFYIMSANLGVSPLIGIAALIGAFSAVIIRSRVLPVIMGWLGAIVALIALVGAAVVATTDDALFDISLVGFLTASLWVLIVSILMFMRRTREIMEVDVVVVADGSAA